MTAFFTEFRGDSEVENQLVLLLRLVVLWLMNRLMSTHYQHKFSWKLFKYITWWHLIMRPSSLRLSWRKSPFLFDSSFNSKNYQVEISWHGSLRRSTDYANICITENQISSWTGLFFCLTIEAQLWLTYNWKSLQLSFWDIFLHHWRNQMSKVKILCLNYCLGQCLSNYAPRVAT